MPLSVYTRRCLANGLASESAADDLADVVDAGSGTIDAITTRRLEIACANRQVALGIAAKVNAGTALVANQGAVLGMAINSRVAAAEIAAALNA
jgi:hypothetical protein